MKIVLLAVGFLLGGLAVHYADMQATCESPDGRQQHTISNPFDYKHAT